MGSWFWTHASFKYQEHKRPSPNPQPLNSAPCQDPGSVGFILCPLLRKTYCSQNTPSNTRLPLRVTRHTGLGFKRIVQFSRAREKADGFSRPSRSLITSSNCTVVGLRCCFEVSAPTLNVFGKALFFLRIFSGFV